MFYCPKCNQKFEDDVQRFCNNDGSRLLPETSIRKQTGIKDKSVFTNILAKTKRQNEKNGKIVSTPEVVKFEKTKTQFEPQQKSKIFKTPPEFDSQTAEQFLGKEFIEKKEVPKTAKPISRLINPREVEINQAELGDRRTKPTGRAALTWENPEILIGETIKGRYRITEKLEQDNAGITYLANDEIVQDKKAFVRVLMEENSRENLEDKIFAEERVSLSHINHPNVAKFIDSGELPEGKPFIVTEYIEGKSVRDILENGKGLNPMRVARIIGQTAYALSEVHQIGILHRNLKPEHILLTISESGKEQVKVKDFGISGDGDSKTHFTYKSPEQIGGKLPTFSSDTYSLGAIAYEMLTGNEPFDASSARELIKLQKKGVVAKPSELKSDLSALVDSIIEKALSYNASQRYPKTRDFGEALYNSLMTVSPWEENREAAELNKEISNEPFEQQISDADIHIPATNSNNYEDFVDSELLEIGEEKPKTIEESKTASANNLPIKPTSKTSGGDNKNVLLLSILGFIFLVVAAVLIWQYFENHNEETSQVKNPIQTNNLQDKGSTIQDAADDANNENTVQTDEIEVPPLEREITAPPNSKYFENSVQNLDKDLVKYFRGFSLYYPEEWGQNKSATNFLDISKKDEDGYPKEVMVITHYDSNGTFALDKKIFAKLVESSNEDLKKLVPDYEVVSQGNKTINNGWKAYDVKFKGKTKFEDRENFEIWGKRIWMPAARSGVNNGFVITMLATSLSSRIESLDDIGKKGDLGDILATFEPDRNY
ncbi:MAG: serine/threonine protein kinase [Aridibacter sp.]